jgi:hypothetical protein
MDALVSILLLILTPAALGFVAGKIGPKGDAQGCTLSATCALIPALLFFAITQNADAITRAASLIVTPVVFVIMGIPAMVGVAIARRDKVER